MEITEAIILNVVDYDERDGIVTAFFKDGRIMNIYAQGIQGENSKNRLNLMQFSIVELEYFQKKDRNKAKLMRSTTIVEPTMKNLNDIHLLAGLSSLIDFRLAAGTRIYELFELIIREMEWRTLSNSLIIHFLLSILKIENVHLNFTRCASCGNVHSLRSFDAKRGGMLCEYCLKEYNKRIPDDFIEKIQKLNELRDTNEIEAIILTHEEYRMILDNLLSYIEDILGIYTGTFRKV